MLVKLLTTRAKRAIKSSLTFTLPKVKVKVAQGVVCGCEENLPDGRRKFQRFSGIPYAKPPINELRFRSPQKLLKFDQDEIDCTKEVEGNVQKSMIWKKFVGTEDCLNLNVYVPSDPAAKKLQVMVFIHGGGFAMDNSSRDFYSPEYLLMEDVIVVTINYRLQALGFLCLPSLGIYGNQTLKDQQLALEWIHENISSFNGDPDNVCLFGESAGAACVHHHMLNPKSRRFFKSGILQSNCVLADWMYQKNGVEKSRRLAKILGAKGNSDQHCLNALMTAPAEKIYECNLRLADPAEIRQQLPFVFKPVFEIEHEDAFLTESPVELLKNQKINMPMMIGMNDGDGMTMVNYYRGKRLAPYNEDYVKFVPISLNVDPNSDEAEKLGKEIKELYFGDKNVDETTLKQFLNFMNDFHFTIPQTMTNEFHARYQTNDKQFIYKFCYDGELNLFKELLNMKSLPGACHFDELLYLFDAKILGTEVAVNSDAWKMRETMCKMWTNFAKYNNPTPEQNNPLNIQWQPVDNGKVDERGNIELNYLRIDEEFEMKKNMYKERIDFWRKKYEKYNGGFLNPKY